eukprot:m.147231 g.147231  ORF g.147231 m.147231 type:complete len:219 (-) comp14162_c3_seq3:4272-4928(-)
MEPAQSAEPVVERVKAPFDRRNPNPLAFVVRGAFSELECQEIQAFAEANGKYQPALVNTYGGNVLDTSYRKSERCIVDSHEMAGRIFQRVKAHIPQQMHGSQLVGLNERLRFLRYHPGDYFKPHYDGCYVRDDKSEKSELTLMLYLNDGFEGGETSFLPTCRGDEPCKYVPQKGDILVFEHQMYHEGSVLKQGQKDCMRTDVMYTFQTPKKGKGRKGR